MTDKRKRAGIATSVLAFGQPAGAAYYRALQLDDSGRMIVAPSGDLDPLATLLFAGSDAPVKTRHGADLELNNVLNAAQINTKLTALKAAGFTQRVALVFMGTIPLEKPIDLAGFNNSVFEMRGGVVYNGGGAEHNLAQNVGVGDTVISLDSVTGLSAGMMVWIYDNNENGDNAPLRTIQSVNTVAKTITIDSAAGFAFTVAASGKVVNAFPLFRFTSATSKCEFRGFNIDGKKASLIPSTAKYPIPLLNFTNCTDFEIHHNHLYESRVTGMVLWGNCSEHDNAFRDFANAEEVVHFTTSNGASAKNSKYTDCDMSLGATRICQANYRSEISGNDYKNCRYGINGGDDTINDDTVIQDNNYEVNPAVVTNAEFVRAFKHRVTVTDNHIRGAKYPVIIPNAPAGSVCKGNEYLNCKFLPTEMVFGSVLDHSARAQRDLAYAQIRAILGTSEVATWPLEDISGNLARDISGNAHHFQPVPNLETMTLPPAMQGLLKVVRFNAVAGEYLTAGDSASFTFASGGADTAFSYGFLFTFNAVAIQFLLGKYQIGATFHREYVAYLDAAGKINALKFQESNDSQVGRLYNTALTPGSKYFCIVTNAASALASGIKIYLNKVKVDDTDNNGGIYAAMENETGNLEFGRTQNTTIATSYHLDGTGQPLFLCGKELSLREVNDISDIVMAMAGI